VQLGVQLGVQLLREHAGDMQTGDMQHGDMQHGDSYCLQHGSLASPHAQQQDSQT
jgi:hypothetical protein